MNAAEISRIVEKIDTDEADVRVINDVLEYLDNDELTFQDLDHITPEQQIIIKHLYAMSQYVRTQYDLGIAE